MFIAGDLLNTIQAPAGAARFEAEVQPHWGIRCSFRAAPNGACFGKRRLLL